MSDELLFLVGHSGDLCPSFPHVQQVPSRFVRFAESLSTLEESFSRRNAVGVASLSFLESIATQRPASNKDWYSSSASSQIVSTVGASVMRERADGVLPALFLRKRDTAIRFVAAQTAKVGVDESMRESMTVMSAS